MESADTTSVGDTLNGELKPDPAMLAQRAILKQVKDIKNKTCFMVLCFKVGCTRVTLQRTFSKM